MDFDIIYTTEAKLKSYGHLGRITNVRRKLESGFYTIEVKEEDRNETGWNTLKEPWQIFVT